MNGEDVVYLHNEILVSMDEWKNEIMPVTATWMDLENIIVREISQTEKDTAEQRNTAGWSPVGLLWVFCGVLSLPSCVPVAEFFSGLDGLMQVTCSPQGVACSKPFIILSIISYLLLNTSKYIVRWPWVFTFNVHTIIFWDKCIMVLGRERNLHTE